MKEEEEGVSFGVPSTIVASKVGHTDGDNEMCFTPFLGRRQPFRSYSDMEGRGEVGKKMPFSTPPISGRSWEYSL